VVLGLAFASRVSAGLLGVPALVLVLSQPPHDPRVVLRRGLCLALGCAPGIALVLWFNQVRFGAPFRPYGGSEVHGALEHLLAPWFSLQHWTGMAGLTVSPGKGLLWYAPPLLAVLLLAVPLFRRHPRAFAALGAHALTSVVVFGRFTYWHSDWAWGPRYVASLCVAAAPLAWWLWEAAGRRGSLARAAVAVALPLLAAAQSFPVVGYPVENYLSSTVAALARSGLLVTSPSTRPPLPADHGILYFHPGTSPIISLSRTFSPLVRDPVYGPPVRAALVSAMLVPALALLLVVVVAADERRRQAPVVEGARLPPDAPV
jgi:hypothetical protein